MILKEDFKEYMSKMYPQGTIPIHEEQLKKAFYAGALVTGTLMCTHPSKMKRFLEIIMADVLILMLSSIEKRKAENKNQQESSITE